MAVQIDTSKPNAKYTFSSWQEGIADSPELGFGIMRNVEIGMFPGQAIPGYRPLDLVKKLTAVSYTVDTGTNVFTVSSSAYYPTTAIQFVNVGGTLPAGLASQGDYVGATTYTVGQTVNYNGRIYYALRSTTGNLPTSNYYWSQAYFYVVAAGGNTFTVARNRGGAAIDVTSAGTGTNTFESIVMGQPKNGLVYNRIVAGTNYKYNFIQDSNGVVWYNEEFTYDYFIPIQGNSLNTSTGNGMTWVKGNDDKDWLIVCSGRYVSVLNLQDYVGNSALMTWYNGSAGAMEFTNQDSTMSHQCLLAQDRVVYFCDGRYLTSLVENTGKNFDPTDATTYTFATKSLILPSTVITQCLEELGANLLIGDKVSNGIYPWDKHSTNTETRLRCPEDNIQKMINVDNTVYILAGFKGVIYSTQGYQVGVFKKIPEYVSGGQVTWGGLNKVNGHLYVGVLGNKAEVSGGSAQNGGVYKFFLHTLKPGTFVIDNTPSSGSTTTLVSVILPYNSDSYYMGYTGAVDNVNPYQYVTSSAQERYQNYEAYIETPLLSVSNLQEHRTFELCGLETGRALVVGEGIQISSRLNITDAFSSPVTFDYTTYGALQNEYTISSITGAQSIQFKIALCASTRSAGTDQSPRIKTVVIK